MTAETLLDEKHALMQKAPDDASARLGFFEALAASEIYVLLKGDPAQETVTPRTFDTEDGTFVLAFDTEDRLTKFTGEPTPYAAFPGRALAGMLAQQNVGLALNPEVAPSAIVLGSDAMAWLEDVLREGPAAMEARPTQFLPPTGLPEALLRAIDNRLARAAGLASHAFLVSAAYDARERAYVLGVIDAVEQAQSALASSVNEALVFADTPDVQFDVAFLDATDPVVKTLERVGLRFDVPDLEIEAGARPAAPGSDPNRPPILK